MNCKVSAFKGRQLLLSLVLIVFGANSSNASELTNIPVPTTIIYVGQLVTAQNLRDRSVPVSYTKRVSVYKDTNQVIGKVARKTLLPNRPIFTNTVMEPNVVEINRKTQMRYSQNGLLITVEVNPLNSARTGQAVRARNARTGIVVYGVANEDGSISATRAGALQ